MPMGSVSMDHLERAQEELNAAARKRPPLDARGSRLYDIYVMQAREALTELIDLSWDDTQGSSAQGSPSMSAGDQQGAGEDLGGEAEGAGGASAEGAPASAEAGGRAYAPAAGGEEGQAAPRPNPADRSRSPRRPAAGGSAGGGSR